ncbi:MAG: sulfide-dependent adenosine diphosphate thiazole synthase [Bacillota bacterium]|nr:sulfide-dependent adenosine diphosphate thiazole synthase [Bacillota bacterium]
MESYLKSDVAIVGAGPAGLAAAYYLAKSGHKVAVFEKRLSIGGGMWGGGIMFNTIVFQEEAREIFEEFEIEHRSHGEGYYSADSVLSVTAMGAKTIRNGAKIFNLLSAEDVLAEGGTRVTGLVLNWSSVQMAGLHVDPVAVEASYVIDTTGHDCQVVGFVQNKLKGKLFTKTGKIMGESSMWAESGESFLLEYTREVYPGLYVAGMSASAVYSGHRMGPIFGGMLLSGRKVAREIDASLKKLNGDASPLSR